MAAGDHRKPVKNRQFVKKEHELTPQFSEAESDHDFKLEAAHASDDLSVKSEHELGDKELLRRFRMSLTSNILPKTPDIPGFHLCWIPQSSNNIYDTVDFRKQIGYSVVKPEEVPDFLVSSNRAGQIDGCVNYNELVLMKLPQKIYQLYMRDSHHTQPMEQERVIKQAISQMEDKEGNRITRDEHEMTGISSLARKVAEPNFS